MASEVSNLTNGLDLTDGTSYVTSSILPLSQCLILLTFNCRTASGTITDPTVSGCGLTWVLIKSQASFVGNRKIAIYRAMGSSPTYGAITITCTETMTHATWSVDQIKLVDTSGTNGSGAIVQSGGSNDGGVNTTSCTLTISAFSDSNNIAFGGNNITGPEAVSAGTGFVRLCDPIISDGSDASMVTEYKTNDNTIDWTWTNPNSWYNVGIEVKVLTSFPSPVAWIKG